MEFSEFLVCLFVVVCFFVFLLRLTLSRSINMSFVVFVAPCPPEKLSCSITEDKNVRVVWNPPDSNFFLYPVVGYVLQCSIGNDVSLYLACLPACCVLSSLRSRMPAYLPACIMLPCLTACLSAGMLLALLPACWHASCLTACLSAGMLPFLHTCLLVRDPASLI